AFDGEDDAACKHIFGKRFLQEFVSPHARETIRHEANIIVLCLRIPGRRNASQHDAQRQPGSADYPGMVRGNLAQTIEHARSILKRLAPCSTLRANKHPRTRGAWSPLA